MLVTWEKKIYIMMHGQENIKKLLAGSV